MNRVLLLLLLMSCHRADDLTIPLDDEVNLKFKVPCEKSYCEMEVWRDTIFEPKIHIKHDGIDVLEIQYTPIRHERDKSSCTLTPLNAMTPEVLKAWKEANGRLYGDSILVNAEDQVIKGQRFYVLSISGPEVAILKLITCFNDHSLSITVYDSYAKFFDIQSLRIE